MSKGTGFKFIVVTWPESQYFIGKKNCHLINDEDGYVKYGSSAYFVREDVYKRMEMKHEHDQRMKEHFSNYDKFKDNDDYPGEIGWSICSES